MSMTPQPVTAPDFAAEQSLSVETIWRYTPQKRIPDVEVGERQYRYELEQMLKAMKKTAAVAAEEPKDRVARFRPQISPSWSD